MALCSEFKKRYLKEIEDKTELLNLIALKVKGGAVTFLFSSQEQKLNNAAALKEFFETKFQKSR